MIKSIIFSCVFTCPLLEFFLTHCHTNIHDLDHSLEQEVLSQHLLNKPLTYLVSLSVISPFVQDQSKTSLRSAEPFQRKILKPRKPLPSKVQRHLCRQDSVWITTSQTKESRDCSVSCCFPVLITGSDTLSA